MTNQDFIITENAAGLLENILILGGFEKGTDNNYSRNKNEGVLISPAQGNTALSFLYPDGYEIQYYIPENENLNPSQMDAFDELESIFCLIFPQKEKRSAHIFGHYAGNDPNASHEFETKVMHCGKMTDITVALYGYSDDEASAYMKKLN